LSREDALVEWAETNLGTEGIVFLEVDEDTIAHDGGHLAGAVRVNWTAELQDQVRRDIVDADPFAALLSAKGVTSDDTVVLHGGNNNWSAANAYWQFKLSGHTDVRLLDVGRRPRPAPDRDPRRAARTQWQ
jgi:thiosulfate/3-mercaptopyruvate sulfurtransferase